MTAPATLADVDELVAELRQLGNLAGDGDLSVDVDASKVNVPGVWVLPTWVRPTKLRGVTFGLTLHLIGPDTERHRGYGVLLDLYNRVMPYVETLGGIDGDARFVAVQMPDNARLPALALNIEIDTESE